MSYEAIKEQVLHCVGSSWFLTKVRIRQWCPQPFLLHLHVFLQETKDVG